MKDQSVRLLTVTETAEILGLKESTIRRRILERRIAYFKFGRAVRIPLEAVEQLMVAGYHAPI